MAGRLHKLSIHLAIKRSSEFFQSRKVQPRVCAAVVMGTAHLQRGHQLPAHGGTLGQAEEAAAPLLVKLHAGHAGGFALRHARDWRRDRGRGAAGTTTGPAIQSGHRVLTAATAPTGAAAA